VVDDPLHVTDSPIVVVVAGAARIEPGAFEPNGAADSRLRRGHDPGEKLPVVVVGPPDAGLPAGHKVLEGQVELHIVFGEVQVVDRQ